MPLGSDDTVQGSLATNPASERYSTPPPTLAGRYELLGMLGRGGMGAVYRVRDQELGEVIALKMLHPELGKNPAALDRFRSEVRLARRVTHRNVARMFDIGDHGGEKFLTMEWLDGGSLATRIADRGGLPLSEVVSIAQAICAGLSAAHAAGVVHRDLKPENVLFAQDGRVAVADFGIASAGEIHETSIAGTPAYMAPEQLHAGSTIDRRVDVYALGAVLYEMLTGTRAWTGERTPDAPPPDARSQRADIGDRVAEVALRCMAIDPADRFQSADDVAALLADVAPVGAPPRTSRVPLPRSGTTVAVMPFGHSGNEADHYIADGLSSDITDTLSTTRGLRVRARGLVAPFVGRPIADMVRELGVDVIVEGTLQRIGDVIRIGVRAIGTADGFQLWAHRFDTQLDQLLVISDQIARELAGALATTLPASAARAADPAAIELYLRAKQVFLRDWQHSGKEAAEQFENALRLSPSDPHILTGTVRALSRMLFFAEGDREAIMVRARELTERAVVLAPEIAETWTALAGYRLNAGDAIGAARALRTGLAHAPNSGPLQESLGRLLAETTPLDEAIARLTIALELDPTLFAASVDLSRVHALLGNWDRALSVLGNPGKMLVLDSARARLALWHGSSLPVLVNPQPNSYAELYSRLDRAAGLSPPQRAFMEARRKRATGRMGLLFLQRNAEIFAFVGELDNAMAAVAEAVTSGLIDLAWFDRCPALDPLRSRPELAQLRPVVSARVDQILAALRDNAGA